MKFALILCLTAAACVGLFFFANYSPPKGYSFRRYLLSEIYGEFLGELRQPMQWRKGLFILCGLSGLFCCFYPPIFLLMLRLGGAELAGGVRAALVVTGLVATVGLVVNVVMMLISQMNFSFGGSSDTQVTVFFFVIPIFQAVFALAGIITGVWPAPAGWINRLVA